MITSNFEKKRGTIHFCDVLFYDVIFIGYEYMGRKKLNRTREELLIQQRRRAKRYYERNRKRLNADSMRRYILRSAT